MIMKKTIDQYPKFFETSDLPLATTLCVMGFALYEVERRGARAIFIFQAYDESIDEAVQKYWRKQLTIEPQDYFAEMKMLKARIYER